MLAEQFLNDELAHAERQLARVRRLAAQMEDQLAAQGFSDLDVYDKLARSQAYRQLQRDQVVFQQTWLRVHRHLLRLPQPRPEPAAAQTIEDTLAELEREVAFSKPQPFRKPPTPGPNQPCSCGSRVKFKKCCGNPLRPHLSRAA